MTKTSSRWLALLAAGLLSACVSYGPGALRTGADEYQVAAVMGAPTERYALPDGGTRLAFARGPFGRHTWMVDLDRSRRVVRYEQVLGETSFARLQTGMAEQDVLLAIGPPAERKPVGIKPGEVWSWRYPTNDCLWFQAEFDGARKLRGAGYGTDPRCDAGERAPT